MNVSSFFIDQVVSILKRDRAALRNSYEDEYGVIEDPLARRRDVEYTQVIDCLEEMALNQEILQ